MIFPVNEYKTKMDLKRNMVKASLLFGDESLCKAQLLGLWRTIEDELTRVLNDQWNAPSYLEIRISSETWNRPGVDAVISYFVGMGYGLNWQNGVLTVTWS